MTLYSWRRASALAVLLSAAALCAPAASTAQGRITNAKTETRSAAQGVAREVQAIASTGTVPAGDVFEEIDVRKALREGLPPVKFDLAPYVAAGTLTLISGPPKSANSAACK